MDRVKLHPSILVLSGESSTEVSKVTRQSHDPFKCKNKRLVVCYVESLWLQSTGLSGKETQMGMPQLILPLTPLTGFNVCSVGGLAS